MNEWLPPLNPYHFSNLLQTLAHFTIDIGCETTITGIYLRNSHRGEFNNRYWYFQYPVQLCHYFTYLTYYYVSGTKDWRVMIGNTMNGPWTEIANGSFPDPRLTQYNVPLTIITPSGCGLPAGQVSNISFVITVCWKSYYLFLVC